MAPRAGYEEQGEAFCRTMNIPCKFYNENNEHIEPTTVTNESVSLPIMQIGADVDAGGSYTNINQSAFWVKYSSLHQGSLAIGCGPTTLFQVGTKQWLAGDRLRLFEDFTPEVKLTEFTWVTAFVTLFNVGTIASPSIQLMLERIFIDGETGEWGDIGGTSSDTSIVFNPDNSFKAWMTIGPGHDTSQTAGYTQYHAETRVFPVSTTSLQAAGRV